MVLSRTCIYTVRAVIYLAVQQKPAGEYIGIQQVSSDLNISFHFLTKIFQKLVQAKLVVSYRGPNGGVALARRSEDIRPIDIVRVIDGESLFNECMLGLPECGEARPCPLHRYWSGVRHELQAMLENTSIAQLAEQVRSEDLRLADV